MYNLSIFIERFIVVWTMFSWVWNENLWPFQSLQLAGSKIYLKSSFCEKHYIQIFNMFIYNIIFVRKILTWKYRGRKFQTGKMAYIIDTIKFVLSRSSTFWAKSCLFVNIPNLKLACTAARQKQFQGEEDTCILLRDVN